MGGVFGHMSHLYDNPVITFGKIKDALTAAAKGELSGTEKTDGQNLFLSYDVQDRSVRAARNKGDIKSGGMTPSQLSTKYEGRGALHDAFVNGFRAFELAIGALTDEQLLQLFGPATNIYYNAEVMDPENPNVINYDDKTLLIHRAGHAFYDRETGKPISKPNDEMVKFSEDQAAKLDKILQGAQDKLSQTDFRVEVNAVKYLKALSDDTILETAIAGIDAFMSKHGANDATTIFDYVAKRFQDVISSRFSNLDKEKESLLLRRLMEDTYGTSDEGNKQSRGLTTAQIIKSIDNPEYSEEIKTLLNPKSKEVSQYLKDFIWGLELVIHRFAIEILRTLDSVFILGAEGNEKERIRLHNKVKEAEAVIRAADPSTPGIEDAMMILDKQMQKLRNLEDVSSAAEGFVFDFDGHTYKFTGGFAPVNQIVGLFEYPRGGNPPLKDLMKEEWAPVDKDWRQNYGREDMSGYTPRGRVPREPEERKNIALYPGKFKPPHGGHFNVAKQVLSHPEVDKIIVFVSPREHEGVSAEQAVTIWEYYAEHLPGVVEIRVAGTSPVGSVYDYIDKEAEADTDLHLILGSKDIGPKGRFKDTAMHAAARGINVAEVPVPPQMGGVSATQMRAALKDGDLNSFKKGLPVELNDADVNDIIAILGGNLEEMSSMAGGSVQGAMIGTGSKKGPWHNLDVEKENSRQKRISTLRGAKEFISEEEMLVNEVTDYLLGITVG